MGASGSGKTSLLNVLGQRIWLSSGSKLLGKIKCNNQIIKKNDFSKFGAFVQQDDILLETFTPEESLIFAAKLMTNLNKNEILKKVNDLIMRLGLDNCRHTRIGSQLTGGISGGERKRASIGYELITDPQVILCDEPTSGLDSTTSLKIIKMLQQEAKDRQMTIICTIHQPSSDIFNCFDRVLLLHEGRQIYQGKVKKIPMYLSNHLACNIKSHQNPADFIIKMAQAPHLCNPNLTFEKLVHTYNTY